MARWLGGPAAAPGDRLADEHVLRQCSYGSTLDLGCGPGRFTATLHAGGCPALGVDTSPFAVELTRRRGGAAICADFFQPLPTAGQWHQVLLIDGNIGIGGDPVRTLRRASELLAPGGLILAEINPPGVRVGRELLRWETSHHTGSWFAWSHIDAAGLVQLASGVGIELISVVGIHSRVIAVLGRQDDAAARSRR